MKRRYKTMHAEQADDREPIDLFGGTTGATHLPLSAFRFSCASSGTSLADR
jgi:hypothetical protein